MKILKKNRLIALIDFSLYSHALLELASRWCEIAHAELILVHKVPGLVPAMADMEGKKLIIEGEKEEALEKLKKLVTKKIPASVPVTYLVTEKNLTLSLSEIFKEEYNDYILLGIKGTGMLKKILIGSTATRIIDEVNCLTIGVPDKLCSSSGKHCNLIPEKIIVTLNHKFPLNEAVFSDFLKTFQSSVKEIQFISVADSKKSKEKNQKYLSELSNKYNKYIPASYKIFEGENVFEKLKKHVHQDGQTLLVVQKGSRSFSDQLFRKFLINQLVHDGSIPLIILPL